MFNAIKELDKKLTVSINSYFTENIFRSTFIIKAAKTLPACIAAGYILFLVFLSVFNPWLLFRAAAAPLAALAVVTILRKLINRRRPFEAIAEIKPLIPHGAGQSFPSRHTASSFVIGFTLFELYPAAGAAAVLLAAVVAISRVACGLHYPSDTAAAAVIALLFSALL